MAPNPRLIDERLQALYDALPKIACQGICYDSCGPIDLSVRERERIERRSGHKLGCNGLTCNMLVDGKCSVYEDRPMICRGWGVVEKMRCPYGCVPEGGFMSDADFTVLLIESLRIGGGLTHSDQELWRLLSEAQREDPEGMRRVIESLFDQVVQRPTLQGRGDDKTGVLSRRSGKR